MIYFRSFIFIGLFATLLHFACGVEPPCSQSETCSETTTDANTKETHNETHTESTTPEENTPEQECVPTTSKDCYSGASSTSGIGLCKTGKQTCSAQGTWGSCQNEVTPQTETCNNKDDDCDGQTDEDLTQDCYSGPANTAGIGLCKKGTQTCTAGQWGSCQNEVTPNTEICNNKDDDCDGQIDNNLTQTCYTGPANTAEKGLCKKGTQTCAAGQWGSCQNEVTPNTEICNNKDDDCDGQTDEELTQICYTGPANTAEKGLCKKGSQVCNAGQWGSCQNEVTPQTEICNNKDDDCDGQIDNNSGNPLCSAPQVCTQGTCRTPCQKNEDCKDIERCTLGYCEKLPCSSTYTACAHQCVNTQLSNLHCGACNTPCSSEKVCKVGQCVCGSTYPSLCAGNCVDTTKNDAHCGQCNNPCTSNTFCFQSKCTNSWAQYSNFYNWNGGFPHGGKILDASIDASGNVYIAGRVEKYADFGTKKVTTPNFDSKYSSFLARIDNKGRWAWAQRTVYATFDETRGVTSDPTGNAYVTGFFSGLAKFGTTTMRSNPNQVNMFIAKSDNKGSWKWATGAKGVGGAIVYDNKYIYVTGSAYGGTFGNLPPLPLNIGVGLFVAKIDASTGKWLWVQMADNSKYTSSGKKLALDQSGNVYVVGSASKGVVFGTQTTKVGGGVLAKLDANGKWLWIREIGEVKDGLTIDASSNVYVSGSASSTFYFHGTQITPKGSNDGYIAQFNTKGTLKWLETFTNTNSGAYIRGLVSTPKGIYIAGKFFGTVTVQGMTLKDSFTKGSTFVANINPQGKWSQVKQEKIGSNQDLFYFTHNGARLLMVAPYAGPATLGSFTLPQTSDISMFIWSFPAP